MSIDKFIKLRDELREYWQKLKESDPEEYKRQRQSVEAAADRWQAETDAMTSDDEEKQRDAK